MRIDVGGVGIEFDVTGPEDGPPVLMLHGFPDSARLWRKQVPALADAGYRVITPDLRGFGRSDQPEGVDAYDLALVGMDVGMVLLSLGVERAHVVGHDWGGSVAWGLAALQPQMVDHLVAVSVGHPDAFRAAGLAQQERSWYMLFFLFEEVAERWLTDHDFANFRAWSQHPDEDEIVAAHRDDRFTPGLNLFRKNKPAQSWIDPPLGFPKVEAPTMGVWSTGDNALTEAQMAGSGDFCANGFRFERLEGPGHWIPLEAADRLNALLLDFLPRN